MKTLELKLPTPVLLVWGLPEDTKNTDKVISHRLPKCGVMHYEHLPDGNWQLIGKLSELTEEQAKELVHVSLHSGLSGHYTKGVNPTNVYCYKSGLDSFHSAVEAEGYFVVNPIKKPYSICNCPSCQDIWYIKNKIWQEGRSKTLPANTLIFKRV